MNVDCFTGAVERVDHLVFYLHGEAIYLAEVYRNGCNCKSARVEESIMFCSVKKVRSILLTSTNSPEAGFAILTIIISPIL